MQDFGSDENHELVPGRIRGYRVWRSNTNRPFLASITATSHWEQSSIVAVCHGKNFHAGTPPHEGVPDSACTCGIYACHSPHDMQFLRMLSTEPYPPLIDGTRPWPRTNNEAALSPGRVAGVIEAWGKVTLGRRGFRAEKARIVALAVPSNPPPFDFSEWRIMSINIEYMSGPVTSQHVTVTNVRTGEMLRLIAPLYQAGYPVNIQDHVEQAVRTRMQHHVESVRQPDWLAGYGVPIYSDLHKMIRDLPPISVDDLLGKSDPQPQSSLQDYLGGWRTAYAIPPTTYFTPTWTPRSPLT